MIALNLAPCMRDAVCSPSRERLPVPPVDPGSRNACDSAVIPAGPMQDAIFQIEAEGTGPHRFTFRAPGH